MNAIQLRDYLTKGTKFMNVVITDEEGADEQFEIACVNLHFKDEAPYVEIVKAAEPISSEEPEEDEPEEEEEHKDSHE